VQYFSCKLTCFSQYFFLWVVWLTPMSDFSIINPSHLSYLTSTCLNFHLTRFLYKFMTHYNLYVEYNSEKIWTIIQVSQILPGYDLHSFESTYRTMSKYMLDSSYRASRLLLCTIILKNSLKLKNLGFYITVLVIFFVVLDISLFKIFSLKVTSLILIIFLFWSSQN